MDGFDDFGFGSGDEDVGKKSTRFKAEGGRTYRVSFVWFDDYAQDGTPAEGSNLRFTRCERIYKEGVGYVLITNSNRAAMLDLLKPKGGPRQTIATVICVWPTDKEGELDVSSYKNGKGWKVMPWTFSADKYRTMGGYHKRASLCENDMSLQCTDTKFQKLTFIPENTSLLHKYLGAKSEDLQAVGAKILEEARGVAAGIRGELARDLTVDQVREALGEDMGSPAKNHSADEVDGLLDNMGI